MSSSVSPARSVAHAALNFALQSSRSVPEAGGNRVAVRRGMAGMSDHYFLDDDGTTIIHCGGGARPQDTHLAIDGALHRIIEWLKRRERRRRRAVKVTERWISSRR
jgi:hypothetical protein